MSVINQMLKDLDARERADSPRHAALAAVGQGSVVSRRRAPRVVWRVAVMAMLLVLALGVLIVERLQTPKSIPALVPAPIAVPVPVVDPALAINEAPLSEGPDEKPRRSATRVADESGAVAASAAEVPPDVLPETRTARTRIEQLPSAHFDPLAAARASLASGDADAALSHIDAVRLSSSAMPVAEADALSALALQQLGRHEAALAAFTRALRGEPDIGAWWAGLGISLEALGRSVEALAAYREAQRRGPLDPALADYLGERIEALSADEPLR